MFQGVEVDGCSVMVSAKENLVAQHLAGNWTYHTKVRWMWLIACRTGNVGMIQGIESIDYCLVRTLLVVF